MATTLVTLPSELRLHILGYTDLITPSREVIWSRQDNSYVAHASNLDPSAPADVRHSTQFFRCWRDSMIGCFCRRRHAAFSLRCKCWAPPGPLFLVCRTLYRDSQLVFVSRNRFVVHDFRSHAPWRLPFLDSVRFGAEAPSYSYPFERLAISHFLQEVVPTSSLAYLRFLEMSFPPYLPASWPQTEHPAMRDWWETVDWLRDKVTAPSLTLQLVVLETSNKYNPECYSPTITFEEGTMIMDTYKCLLRPLKSLAEDGLARFYANLAYPWELEEPIKRHGEEKDSVEDGKKKVKEYAEGFIMGDRYGNLYADNKEESNPSRCNDRYY